jgi:hypothetical protein
VGPIASNSIHLYMRVPCTNLISGSHPPHKHLTCGSRPQLAKWVLPTSRPRPTKWVPPRPAKSVPHTCCPGPIRWVSPDLPTQVDLALDLACGFRPELTSGSHLELPWTSQVGPAPTWQVGPALTFPPTWPNISSKNMCSPKIEHMTSTPTRPSYNHHTTTQLVCSEELASFYIKPTTQMGLS